MIVEEELKSPKPARKKKNKPEEISLEDFYKPFKRYLYEE